MGALTGLAVVLLPRAAAVAAAAAAAGQLSGPLPHHHLFHPGVRLFGSVRCAAAFAHELHRDRDRHSDSIIAKEPAHSRLGEDSLRGGVPAEVGGLIAPAAVPTASSSSSAIPPQRPVASASRTVWRCSHGGMAAGPGGAASWWVDQPPVTPPCAPPLPCRMLNASPAAAATPPDPGCWLSDSLRSSCWQLSGSRLLLLLLLLELGGPREVARAMTSRCWWAIGSCDKRDAAALSALLLPLNSHRIRWSMSRAPSCCRDSVVERGGSKRVCSC